MKRNLLYLTVASGVAFGILFSCKKSNNPEPPPPPASNVNLKKGLLVYLPFNGNIADSSGNANPTASMGMTLANDEHGYPNSAISGNGAGQRLFVTNNGSIKFDTAFTFSCNMMIRAVKTHVFASLVDNTTGLGPTFELCANIPNSDVLDFAVMNSNLTCNTAATPSNSLTDTTSYSIVPESWYNIVSIFHKGKVTIYANGKQISTKTDNFTVAKICPNSKLIVGGWWDNDALSINGKMDEIRLYDRVLNAEEIAELAKNFQ